MTEIEIVQFIQDNDFRKCDRAIEIIYKDNYHLVESMILSNSGTKEDAKDIFQEAIIAFYKNIKSERYTYNSKISTYLFAVARNQWLKKLRTVGRTTTIDESKVDKIHYEIDHLEVMQYTEKQKLIGSLIAMTGEKCKKILQFVYYEKLKMDKVANLLQLASAQEARNQKLKCMRKLKLIVSDNDFYQKSLKTS